MRALALTGALLAALSAPAPAAELNDDAFAALLARSPVTGRPVATVAELVPLLPDELRQNFTFVYDSRSPFKDSISPDFPRVILFSEDGTRVVTFTGDPARPGHDLVETMWFDRARAAFTLRAYVLPAGSDRAREQALEAGCPKCHGDDPRPIFDAYPLWPGFYGSIQDTFPRDLEVGRREERAYRHFLQTQAAHGVYEGLRWVQGSPVSPYGDPRKFDPRRLRGAPPGLVYEPNTRLGMALTELNRARIARKLRAAPGFADKERALTAALLDCPGTPPADTTALVRALRDENTARLQRLGLDPTRRHALRLDMQELGSIANLAALDRLARDAGVSRADWSMALEPDAGAFFDGVLGAEARGKSYYLVEDLLVELLSDLARTDARLRPFVRVRASFPRQGYPFGNKLDLDRVAGACPILRAP